MAAAEREELDLAQRLCPALEVVAEEKKQAPMPRCLASEEFLFE